MSDAGGSLPSSARVAVQVAPGEPFELREYDLVPPRPGGVLVKVERANICGSDLHLWKGEALGPWGQPFPFVPGHEFVGTVAALGEGVSQDSRGEMVREGDRLVFSYHRGCGSCEICLRDREHACPQAMMSVLADASSAPHFVGGFGEYYYMKPRQRFFKVSPELPVELLAGCNCALSQVICGIRRVGIDYGDRVVVQGAGGLGLYATAVAREMGASQVIVIDGVPERLALAERFGADATIDIQEMTEAKERTAKVAALTGGGADVVIEVVGRAAVIKEGIRLMRRGGRYLVMGAIVPRDRVEIDPSILVGSNQSLHGVALYEPSDLFRALQFVERNHARLPLGEMYGKSYPLAEVNEAIVAADALGGSASVGRIQLTMNDA